MYVRLCVAYYGLHENTLITFQHYFAHVREMKKQAELQTEFQAQLRSSVNSVKLSNRNGILFVVSIRIIKGAYFQLYHFSRVNIDIFVFFAKLLLIFIVCMM